MLTSTTQGSNFRYSLPPPPHSVPTVPIPYTAPTSWPSLTLLPTSLGPPGSVPSSHPASTELTDKKDEPIPSSQINQSTSITSVPGGDHSGQADLVVSQAHPAVSDQQPREQQQGQQLPEQPQQQQVLVASEPIRDL